MITAETITDSQIRSLRREARNQGDDLQVAICTVALADIASIDGDQRAALESVGIVMCADAINEASAMDDSQAVRS